MMPQVYQGFWEDSCDICFGPQLQGCDCHTWMDVGWQMLPYCARKPKIEAPAQR